MKILFAVPPFVVLNSSVPYGIAMVATVAKKAGLDVHMHLPYQYRSTMEFQESLVKRIKDEDFDVVCFTGLSPHYPEIERLIGLCKKAHVITVLGGNIINATPEVVMENIGADYGVIGEGEETFKELMFALIKGEGNLTNIDGLIYKRDGKLIRTNPRTSIIDLDSLPYIDDELINFEYTVRTTGKFFVCASRSCPYKCTFCYHHEDSHYRKRSVDNLLGEIEYLLAKYKKFNIHGIGFIDDIFYTDKKDVFDFCDRIKKYNLKIEIVSTRMDAYDDSMLSAMRNAGCYNIGYGVESINNRVLKSIGKHLTSDVINERIDLTLKNGIDVRCNVILGDIEDDWQSMSESITWAVARNQQCWININPMRVLPGSYIYKYAIENKIITNELEFLENGCPLVNITQLSNEEYQLMLSKIVNSTIGKIWAFNLPLNRQLTFDTFHYEFNLHRDGLLDYNCYCSRCLNPIEFRNIDRQKILYKPNSLAFHECPKCNNRTGIETSDLISRKPDNILIQTLSNEYFTQYKGSRIAICGMTDQLRTLLFENQTLRDCLVKIVDSKYLTHIYEKYCGITVDPIITFNNIGFDHLLIGNRESRDQLFHIFPKLTSSEKRHKTIDIFCEGM